MKRFICWFKAIPDWLATGIWCPHLYKEESNFTAIVISRKNGFRVANNYMHRDDEQVHPNATVVTIKCQCCGKTQAVWYVGEIPII